MSKHYLILLTIVGTITLCLSDSALAGGVDDKPKPVVNSGATYKPPLMGAPSPRSLVGGGTRTLTSNAEQADENLPVAISLRQTSFTGSAEPRMFYWSRNATPVTVTIGSISQTGRAQFDVPTEQPISTTLHSLGIYPISLADNGFRLKKGVEYRWTITAPGIPASGGSVIYQEPSQNLQDQLRQADLLTQAKLYTNAGYWLDALDLLLTAIESRTGDTQTAKQQLATLLDGTGLTLNELTQSIRATSKTE